MINTATSINIFNKEVNNRRYSSAFAFGEHKVALIQIHAVKIDKNLTLFGELYPEYILDIRDSIESNCTRMINEYGIERLGFFTKIKLRRHISYWVQKLTFSTLRNSRLTQKDTLNAYRNIYEGLCKILSANVKMEVVSVRSTTIQKTIHQSVHDVLSNNNSLYSKDKLRGPLWWVGYIKECLNKLTNVYGQTATIGLFELICSGFIRDIESEVANKPLNWGCHYRLSNRDKMWSEHQYKQTVNLQTSSGMVVWFLYKMYTELFEYQFSKDKKDTVKVKTFFDRKFAAPLYVIFKACKGNKMRFFGCVETIANISLIMLDEPSTDSDRVKINNSVLELLDEFQSYLTEFCDVDKLKSHVIKLSFTKEFMTDMNKMGFFNEYSTHIDELPVECPLFITEVTSLGTMLKALLQIFTHNKPEIVRFFWNLWDTVVLDDSKKEADLRSCIEEEITKLEETYVSTLYSYVRQADIMKMKWISEFGGCNKQMSPLNKETLQKLSLFLSFSDINTNNT